MDSEIIKLPAEESAPPPPVPAEPAFVVVPIAEWNALVAYLHGGGSPGAQVSPQLFDTIFGSARALGIIRSAKAVPAGTSV